jgi:hypothetical protein
MSAIEILASAAQADADASDGVDVSAFSTLRLDWSVTANQGANPQIDLHVDHAPTADGPWTELWHHRMTADGQWQTAPRTVLGGFDAFVRARWSGHGRNANGAAAFTISLTGDGKPDAA